MCITFVISFSFCATFGELARTMAALGYVFIIASLSDCPLFDQVMLTAEHIAAGVMRNFGGLPADELQQVKADELQQVKS